MNTQLKNNPPGYYYLPVQSSFLVGQAFIALILLILSGTSDWQASAGWWPMAVALADLFCLYLLIPLVQKRRQKFLF